MSIGTGNERFLQPGTEKNLLESITQELSHLSIYCLPADFNTKIEESTPGPDEDTSETLDGFPALHTGAAFYGEGFGVRFFQRLEHSKSNFIEVTSTDIGIRITCNSFGKYFRCFDKGSNTMVALYIWYASIHKPPRLFVINESILKEIHPEALSSDEIVLLQKMAKLFSDAKTLATSLFMARDLAIFRYKK